MATAGQMGRLIAVDTPLGPDKLMLLRYTGPKVSLRHFLLNWSYFRRRPLVCDIVGKPVTVTIALPSGGRYIDGSVSRFGQTEAEWNFRHYSAQVVPWLWLLTRAIRLSHFPEQIDPGHHRAGFQDAGPNGLRVESDQDVSQADILRPSILRNRFQLCVSAQCGVSRNLLLLPA